MDRFPSLLNLSPFDSNIVIPTKLIEPFHLLVNVAEKDLRFRFSVIQNLNMKIAQILPLVDFRQVAYNLC